jgi:LuxR family quorum sensing-dependent transcriptional regulator
VKGRLPEAAFFFCINKPIEKRCHIADNSDAASDWKSFVMQSRIESGLEFIERCAVETDIEQLIANFIQRIKLFGFESSAAGAWEGNGANRVNRFFFVDWPQDVLDAYVKEDLVARDPLVFAARRRIAPFLWDDIRLDPQMPDESQAMFAFAGRHGYLDGYSVPIHGPGGYQGLVAMLARKRLALGAHDRAVLEIMARTLHERCRITEGLGNAGTDAPKLTQREFECMRWVAAGKTNWEVGQVLGISGSTVHFHVERVKKKLNKNTRTEAVAMLVLHGLI